MREIVVLSGKGGTGKTSLTAAFAALAENKVLCDADVDAADLYLLAGPEVIRRTPFMGGGIASIVNEKCSSCGTCLDLCRFGAIDNAFNVNPLHCEGCGVCVDLCPEEAIDFPPHRCGEWYVSESRLGPMVHARLGIAEENSGKLVSLVRKEARELAAERGCDLLLTDGPPGIGCPVIASITGATALVLIVEPTVSGLHDMERVAELATHFKVPCMVCINKYDLNREMTRKVESVTAERNMQMVGRVPFDPLFVEAMVQGRDIVEYRGRSLAAQAVRDIWQRICTSPVVTGPRLADLQTIMQPQG